MPHALNWFEIPVTDFARARTFYETVLGITIAPMEMGPTTMGMLSTDPSAVGGAIPISSDAKITMRRAINLGSSPAEIILLK